MGNLILGTKLQIKTNYLTSNRGHVQVNTLFLIECIMNLLNYVSFTHNFTLILRLRIFKSVLAQ